MKCTLDAAGEAMLQGDAPADELRAAWERLAERWLTEALLALATP
jgi:hypothetical protein